MNVQALRSGCSRRANATSRGASPRPSLVVSRAEGARVWDADGREFLDFAGGIGCAEPRPRPRCVLEPPSTSRSTATSTSASWSGRTSPTWRSAGGSPSSRPAAARPEVDPPELGRGGGRERRQDRARRDRPAGRDRLRARLPRPDAADADDDREGRLQGRLRPVRARGLPRAGALPLPRHHDRRRDRGARAAAQGGGRPGLGRLRRARAGAGRRRVHPDAARLPAGGFAELLDGHGILYVDDEVQSGVGRTGRSGRSSTTTSSPTCSSRASRSAAACRSPRSPAAPS